jgi:hypothetical protein
MRIADLIKTMKQIDLLAGSLRHFMFFLPAAVCFLFCSCGISHEVQTAQHYPAASSPMACKIMGEVTGIIRTVDEDTGSVCVKHHCSAMVKIKENYGCGSSPVFSINRGDTIMVRFTTTLANTSKVFPQMQAHYPGLKKGSVFVADVVQHPKVGGGAEFIIDGYEVVLGK